MTNTIKPGTRLYVAGPMSGYPQFNFPAFDAAIERLGKRGYIAVPPVDLLDPEARRICLASMDGKLAKVGNKEWADFLSEDVKLIAKDVDGVAVLEGWERSRGARLETFVARLCNKPIVYEDTLEPVSDLHLVTAWAGTANVVGDYLPEEFQNA